MAINPVIMCGGAGTRLWPASRPSRPKQFIPLAGNRSLFQETVLRVAPLAGDGGRVIVVGGVSHRVWIVEQLAEINVEAQILLEPQARDSAPAMAAAAAWVARENPEAMVAFVASDHHIPDHEAFRSAIREAAVGANAGRIVTLGVTPTEPSSAYGYIKKAGRGLSPIEAFCEKPDASTAALYITQGYLWNSGNFIVSAATLLSEMRKLAPAVEASAQRALPVANGLGAIVLQEAFSDAPRVSIDYAVMEKTDLASVLEVDFAWSDLGAWDAIAASGEGDTGVHIFEDAEGCLVRAPDGVLVAALGVKNLAIVVEPDAVLVCDLSRSQDVKRIVERLRATSPQHLDFPAESKEAFGAGAKRFSDWLRLRALPLWSTIGLTDSGQFAETLTKDGRALSPAHRARVQARQIYVYAQAGALGWAGPWRQSVAAGLARLQSHFRRDDGLFRTILNSDGSSGDETAMVYDQAFVLLALASAASTGLDEQQLENQAVQIRESLLARALPNGAIREAGSHPFQSNAHMHLLEACLAWAATGKDGGWAPLADSIARLALETFIDPEGGFLREFFSEDWSPADGSDGRLVEPGHQFEWAWLLAQQGRNSANAEMLAAARTLYASGRDGVSEQSGCAVDAVDQDGSVRTGRSRLWPQTEWLKAALILAQEAEDGDREVLMADASAALLALWKYLEPDGLWADKMLQNGEFIDEPAPASSLYHIMAAFRQVSETIGVIGADGVNRLDLK